MIRVGVGIRKRVWTSSDVTLLSVLNAAVGQAGPAVHGVFIVLVTVVVVVA